MKNRDELWEQEDKILGEIEFALHCYQEDSQPSVVVTDDYPTIESFIGTSVLETGDGKAGYIADGENQETVFIQYFSDDKKIHTYIKDGKIIKCDYLVIDKELETQAKKVEYLLKKVKELQSIQKDLEIAKCDDWEEE